jgi:ABC-type multidrug transport system ATPase subunit
VTALETARTAAVRCEGLTFRFGDHTAVDHADLRIEPGEMYG